MSEKLNNENTNNIETEIKNDAKKMLICALDLHYYRILNFFEKVSELPCDVLIFTTRRCLILYYIFYKYVFDENLKETFKSKKIISDKGILLNSDKIKGKDCVVLDDVVIHGRSLSNVVDRVETADPSDFKTYVYAYNEDADCQVDYCAYCTRNHSWEEVSNKIISAIIMVTFPYAVYAYSFSKRMNMKEYLDFEKTITENYPICYNLDLSLNESKIYNGITDLISKNVISKVFFIDENNSEKVVRVYYNKILKTCTVIPFCFIKNLDENAINEFIKKINYDKYDFENAEIQTKYRLIQTCCSLKIIENDNNVFGNCLKNDWTVNSDQVDSGYFDGMYNYIKDNNLDVDDVLDKPKKLDENIIDNDNKKKNVYFDTQIDNEVLSFKLNSLNKYEQAKLKIKTFVSTVHINEESSFHKKGNKDYSDKKQTGISLLGLFEKVYNQNICDCDNSVVQAFYAALIECFDTGLVTLYPEKMDNEGKSYCSEFLITGEQVCRLLSGQGAILLKEILQNFILKKSDYGEKDEKKLKNNCKQGLNNHFDNCINKLPERYSDAVKKIKNEVMMIFDEFDDPRDTISLINGLLLEDIYVKIFYKGSSLSERKNNN